MRKMKEREKKMNLGIKNKQKDPWGEEYFKIVKQLLYLLDIPLYAINFFWILIDFSFLPFEKNEY